VQTERSIMNALLRGLNLHEFYRFKKHYHDIIFWMKEGNKWERQEFRFDTWIPLAEGELARLALKAQAVTAGVSNVS
jgi:hypothetical protein